MASSGSRASSCAASRISSPTTSPSPSTFPGPTFRHEQYADYKATRVRMPDDLRDQFPKVREVVKALRIPVYEMAGYEADDVIGTITSQLDDRDDLETTIVTVDLDMLQLVTPRVRLMTTRSGVENTVMYDVARIDERFGLRPDQMIDYKALKGDPTDNIPGVPGVGEKTAAKLIREFGTLDALFERLDDVTPEKLRDKLREHRDQVLMGRELTTIVRDLPVAIDLEAARLGDYDRDTVVRLFREYEFRTLIERLAPDGRRDRGGADGAAALRRPERLRARGARRRWAPGGLGPGTCRGTGPPRERRAAAAPRLRRGRRPGAQLGWRHRRRPGARPVRARGRPADRPRPGHPRPRAASRSWAWTRSTTSSHGLRRSRRSVSRSWPTTHDRGVVDRSRWRSQDPRDALSLPTAPRPPTHCVISLNGVASRWSATR